MTRTGRIPGIALSLALLTGPVAFAQEKPADGQKPATSPAKEARPEPPPKPKIAVFRLSGPIQETPKDDVLNLGGEVGVPLQTLVSRLDKAAGDPAVKAVVILLEGPEIGASQVEEVRQAIGRVRAAGKEVYAHADEIGGMGHYVLLTAASTISVTPTSELAITGLYGESPYLRRLLDKIGVKPDFLTCGDYKSAAEIFLRDGPSKEAEAMQNWLLDSLYETAVARAASGRKVGPAIVQAWIDSGPHSAEKAKELGMIDAVEHRQDLEARLAGKYGKDVAFDRKYGRKAEPKLDASSPFGLFKFWGELLGASKASDSKKPAVGVVYVEGPIVVGGGGASDLFQDAAASGVKLRRALDQAAGDDAIRAIVLRVDSPGGSALASEIILDATRRVKAKKPFVVSMGDVAGSGGYYVACASDTVFADASTITASIGVVSGKLATKDVYDRLGVDFKSYRRGQNAGMLASGEVFSPGEKLKMRALMDETYGVFKGHVVAARGNRLKKPIDDLAGGRVFTGKQALELGLVDRLGTLHDAIAFAADQAKVKDYEIRTVPRPRSFLEQLLDEGSDDEGGKRLNVLQRPSLFELAAPHLKALDPARASLVRAALGRLELIRREGVVLMMPELAAGR
ncbi:signal peptide peptidase SppA [Aquisphaera insulae]|uniref:signal peptide peptidase SppA n=1 Tax=Aquisphaera insulae TaxID=2712864 RepID=UPI0013ED5A40|nr:signal peptide peptidase SppA [Aquisphaera insulae]